MRVVVAGGHGQIGRRLLRLLAERGDEAVGLVRNPDHVADLEALGAEGVVADLEGDAEVAAAIEGADAVVFAAGAGPGSGAGRKRTMDLGGALKLMDAAKAAGVSRYLMISAMGTSDPAAAGPMQPYLEAKAEADAALRDSGLDWTILKPGRLTDDPGSGHVALAEALGRRGEVSRDDVAAVLTAALEEPATVGRELELLAGDTPIPEAVRAE